MLNFDEFSCKSSVLDQNLAIRSYLTVLDDMSLFGYSGYCFPFCGNIIMLFVIEVVSDFINIIYADDLTW